MLYLLPAITSPMPAAPFSILWTFMKITYELRIHIKPNRDVAVSTQKQILS